MTFRKLSIALIAALGLSACVPTPTQYLALAPAYTPSVSGHPVDRQDAGIPIVIAHVQMPAALDRLYLTTERGPNHLQVANHVRWIAPLGGMTQQVLAEDLAHALPQRNVLMPGDPTPTGHYLLLRVVIQRFIPIRHQQVALQADWSLLNGNTHKVLISGRNHVRQSSGATAVDQARAMSRALNQLVNMIATRIA
ncbi:MAG: PqiC family protein [Acidiferrobacter sp.]